LNAARCSLNGEERAVPKPTVSGIIAALNQSRRIFPPLKKLLFEVFWFVFAAVENRAVSPEPAIIISPGFLCQKGSAWQIYPQSDFLAMKTKLT
jgi:hypothetical protein